MVKRARVPRVFKNVIAPIQAWLLFQGRCVGCGRELMYGGKTKRKDGTEKVVCDCGRIFIYDPKASKWHRALLDEV